MPFISPKSLVVREGVISGLQRATHVSGGGESSTRTTHLCLFSLGNERVKLALRELPPIADGDLVRISGYPTPGLLNAIACRNLTTGWMSSSKTPGCGCLLAGALVFSAGGLIASGILYGFTKSAFVAGAPFVFLLPLAYAGYSLLRSRNLTQAAHAMIST